MSAEKTLEEQLNKQRLPRPGEEVLLGLSGGGDSMAAFWLLVAWQRRIGFSLTAIHVNHGIRGLSAEEDEAFVRQVCREAQVPLVVRRADVPEEARRRGESLELAGRNLRREVYAEEARVRRANGPVTVVLAHHANDQEETIVMNFLRGSGPAGLGGMAEECLVEENGERLYRLWRPFLGVPHETLLAYLRELGKVWREDESNADEAYRRNRLRHDILPHIKEIYPGLTKVLQRNADIFRDLDTYMTGQAERFCAQHLQQQGEVWQLPVGTLAETPVALSREILRYVLERQNGLTDVSFAMIEEVRGLLTTQSGRRVIIAPTCVVRRDFDWLVFARDEEPAEDMPVITVRMVAVSGAELLAQVRDGKPTDAVQWLDADKVQRTLRETPQVRQVSEEDYLWIDRAGHSKNARLYLKQQKVDAARRGKTWVVAAGNLVLWIPGHRTSCGFEIDENTCHAICMTVE